jgi:hypothetical protein
MSTFAGPREDGMIGPLSVGLLHLISYGEDDMSLFTCFNPSDTDDPSVGLINGQLALPGRLLRKEVFDPVMEEVRGI